MRPALPSFRLPVAAAALAWAMTTIGIAQAQTVPRRYVVHAELTPSAAVPTAQGSVFSEQGHVAGTGVVIDGTRTRLVFFGGKFAWVTSPVERSASVIWSGGQPTVLTSYATKASADVTDVNDSGWVVGSASKSSAVDASSYATLWKTVKPTDLGAGADSLAEFINSQGWVLGRRYVTVRTKANSLFTSEPFLWRNGKLQRLNTYPSGIVGMGCRGLSDSGVAPCMGLAYDPVTYSQRLKPYLWSNGVYQPVDYAGAQDVVLAGVSRDGLVSGNLTLDGQLRAFVWSNGQFTLLPQVGFTALAPTSQGLLRAYRRFLTPESPYVHQEQHQLWSVSGDAVNVRDLVVASGETVLAVSDLNDRGQLLAFVRSPAVGAVARKVVLSPMAP